MHRLLLIGVLTFGPAASAADPDWFLSLYSGEGLELRTDERVEQAMLTVGEGLTLLRIR